MLSFKNPFSRSMTQPEPAGSSVPAVNESNNAVKRWQLEQGRTRKRVEELSDQLETARAALAQSEHTLGERMAEGLESTTATDAMHRASDHVRALEVARAVAIQKDEATQSELKQAERQVAIAEKDEVCQRLLALALEGEEILVHLKLFRADLARETSNLCVVGGNERFSYGVNEIKAHFDLFLGIANRPVSHDLADSGAFRKYKNWTACVESVCGKAP